jgi:hypothetical protein
MVWWVWAIARRYPNSSLGARDELLARLTRKPGPDDALRTRGLRLGELVGRIGYRRSATTRPRTFARSAAEDRGLHSTVQRSCSVSVIKIRDGFDGSDI